MGIDHQALPEFFRERVEEAQKNQGVALRDETQFYVVNLLSEFLEAKKLHVSEDGVTVDEPLALMYGRGIQTPSQSEKLHLLKTVGDRSLYLSGFFSDSLKRRIVDIDYYISMGEQAYSYISGLVRERRQGELFSEMFGELATKFTPVVNLLAEVSESTELTSDQDLLRLYERWLVTKSARLSDRLRDLGVLPVDQSREPIH